ncbi:cysteine desulfurase family protein [Lachnospira pectinoschiza]|uniref:Cysteine desulfurase n=1 Tax=Lachnospira pectinoschiza TaxID=28052 RepID=A0A1G9VTI4_9FIRM|nr:cysteine desulfurase family protein [Lachnospira pectinoschiza]SDM75528.1 cysteine desulfurase [Lachnospira pectinoschiza]
MEAYLDNSATTRTADPVVQIMIEAMQVNYGNPSAKHMKGVEAENYVKEAASIIAKSLKVLDKEILFTSGGTESNNTAIIGTAMANKRRGNHLIVSSVEHASVKEPFNFLEREGFRVTYLPVNSEGIVDLEALKEALDEETILVSCMHVNNEIGAIEPIEEIGRIVKEYNPDIIYHVDAIQSYGKFRIYPKKLGIDLLSVSGHKIHGPKGSGFLYIKDKTRIKPIIYGGGQQKGMRSGTENVPAIAGLGKAVELIYNSDFDKKIEHLYEVKDHLIDGLEKMEDVQINSKRDGESAPQIVSASFKDVRAEVLLHALEEKNIYVSSGSACSSNKPGLSNTLVAIGLANNLLDSTIRFSFNYETSIEEIDYALDVLNTLVPQLRRFVRK